MSPCQPVNERFFFRQIFVRFLLYVWTLRNAQFPAKKAHTYFNESTEAHRTRVQIFRNCAKKQRRRLCPLCVVSVQKLRRCLAFLSFSMESTLGVKYAKIGTGKVFQCVFKT